MTINDLREGLANWKLTKARGTNFLIGLTAVLTYEFIARPIYRPYIYRNKLNDFHLADTIGNTLGVVATIFVSIGFLGQERIQHLFLIRSITLSVVLYEVGQPLLGKPIDPWDIVATILTGGLCFMLYKSIHPVTLDEKRASDKTTPNPNY